MGKNKDLINQEESVYEILFANTSSNLKKNKLQKPFTEQELKNCPRPAVVGAGLALVPALPIALVGDLGSGIIKAAAGITNIVAYALCLPSAVVGWKLFNKGLDSNNKFCQVALCSAGALATVPGLVISSIDTVALGVLKLASLAVNGLTLAATAPFKLLSKGILKASKKEVEIEEDIIDL